MLGRQERILIGWQRLLCGAQMGSLLWLDSDVFVYLLVRGAACAFVSHLLIGLEIIRIDYQIT